MKDETDLIGALDTAAAANTIGVTEKTIQEWVNDGMPVIRKGRRGGEPSLIDPIELFLWKLKIDGGTRDQSMIDFWAGAGAACDGNVVRYVVELYNDFSQKLVLSRVLGDWAGTAGQFGKYGLNEQQAKAVAYQLWHLSALYMDAYLVERFEHDLKRKTMGMDLDGIATLLMGSRVTSTFSKHDTITTPPSIHKLMPPDIAEKLQQHRTGKG